MGYKNYKEFVLNYKPFEWEVSHSDFRETFKGKHKFMLERCGFEVIKHEYFDRKQGDFFIDKKNNTIKKHKIGKRLKNIIYQLVKNTGFLIPHLRNHQIILAKKIKNIDEIIQKRVITTSMEEWMEIRKNTLGY